MSGLVVSAVLAFNILLLGGTAFLVGWRGWSPWWFLLAILCLSSVKAAKGEGDE